MTATSLAYLVTVLLLAVAMAEVKTRAGYRCPSCGSDRADGHSPERSWRGKP